MKYIDFPLKRGGREFTQVNNMCRCVAACACAQACTLYVHVCMCVPVYARMYVCMYVSTL
jgi:hypothetical protein